jgi:hypothetical protein
VVLLTWLPTSFPTYLSISSLLPSHPSSLLLVAVVVVVGCSEEGQIVVAVAVGSHRYPRCLASITYRSHGQLAQLVSMCLVICPPHCRGPEFDSQLRQFFYSIKLMSIKFNRAVLEESTESPWIF